MKPDQVYCILDYETRSEADIKKVGGYEYARHKTTRLLCASWVIGTRAQLEAWIESGAKPESWSPMIASGYGSLKRALLDPSVIIVAHNAFFEQVITRFVLSRLIHNPELKTIPASRWICTATLGAVLALPRKLADVGAALDLPIQKDDIGHRLMLKMSKPKKPSKKNPGLWHNKLSDLKRLMQYCDTDIIAETLLFLKLPPLSPKERELWLLDQKINMRGFKVDRSTVKKVLHMIAKESIRWEKETGEITSGIVRSTKQIDATLSWLGRNGCHLPDLTKQTVEDAIKSGMASGDALRILRLRQEASKSSVGKYDAFEKRSRTTGEIRDSILYRGASTGRFSGSGLQPHNFPRPSFEDTDFAADFLADLETDLDWINFVYGSPVHLFSDLLRSMIVPRPGKKLFDGDFAGIEVKVLFWLAKHEDGLEAFRCGRDLYCELATVIYGYLVTKFGHPVQRQIGKKGVLGAGFQLGWERFFDSCAEDGIPITKELAQKTIKAYRQVHYPVVQLWANLERAAIAAVRNPKKKYTINRTTWFMRGEFLMCQLPSGRLLPYYRPSLRTKLMPWKEQKLCLYFYGIHPKTKRLCLESTYGGKLAENVTQAVAADLMTEAMPRVENAGYDILITVHDELLCEKEDGKGSEKELQKLMEILPAWAGGIPVTVETWEGYRYKK